MSSLDEYQNLGKDLGGYIAAVKTNSGALGLQEAFKSGGKLFDVMQMLDKKEKEIRNYEDQLLKAFDPQNPGEITLDYVNKRTAENGVELAEIKLLKDRLSDLSSAVGQKTSGFAMTRAVNEFSEGVVKHEKVSKGFFSTFVSFIGSVFKGKDEQKLVQASSSLDVRTNAISNESQERFTIPGKGGKESPEIPPLEQVVQKGMSSQEIGGMPPPSEMPPPLPSSMSEVRSPISSPLSEVGGGLPPPPSMSEVGGGLPPPPSMSEVGGGLPPPPPLSGLNLGELPPPPPPPPLSGLNLGELPPPPPPPLSGLNLGELPPPPPPLSGLNLGELPPPPLPSDVDLGGGLPPPLPSGLNLGELPPPPLPSDVDLGGGLPPPLPSSLNVGGIPEAPPPPSELNIPKPPPPPPPPPMSEGVGGLKPPPKRDIPIDSAPKKDLLSQIRERGRAKPLSLNHPNYLHVTTQPKVEKSTEKGLLGGLKARMGEGEERPIEQRLLDGASKKDQQNILYSAMVDNNEKLVTALLKHQSEFNTGEQRENEDGWEEEIVEKRSTFSPEQVETVRKAAEETKLRVAAGIDLVTKEDPKPITPKVEVSPTTTVKVESVLPIPPSPISGIGEGGPPPPPPLKETVVNEPKISTSKPIVVPDTGGLFAQIREGGKKLKAVSSPDQGSSLNSGEFTYKGSTEKAPSSPSKEMGFLAQALQGRRGGIEGSEEALDEAMVKKLEKLSTKDQLNELYSAVIDGNKEKIERIVRVAEEQDLGAFTKENMEKIASAAQKISATQDISKKTIIEGGVKHLAKEAEININVGENRGRG